MYVAAGVAMQAMVGTQIATVELVAVDTAVVGGVAQADLLRVVMVEKADPFTTMSALVDPVFYPSKRIVSRWHPQL